MTITAQTAKSGPYNGNGSTVTFSYAFRVDDQDDLVVTLRAADGTETVQTITTHYTVAGVGEASGGAITMVTAPATGEQLVITRAVGLTQEVDLQNRGSVDPETLERAYDKLTQIAQDQQQQIDQSLKISVTEGGTPSLTLQGSVQPNTFLGFDDAGNLSQFLPSGNVFISPSAAIVAVDDFTGDGITVNFTLGGLPVSVNNLFIFLDGVMQDAANYTVSGTTLTFTTAPPLNTNIEVRRLQAVALTGGTTADLVTYSPSGSGAVTRTVQNRLRDFVSVKDFGAVGDGVTDDTAAIQAALDTQDVAYTSTNWWEKWNTVEINPGNRIAVGSYQSSYPGVIEFNALEWPVNATVVFNAGSGEHVEHKNNIADDTTPVNEWRHEAPYHPGIVLNQRTAASYAPFTQPAHSLGDPNSMQFASIVFQQDTKSQFQFFADLGQNDLQVKTFPPVAGGFLSKVWHIDAETGDQGIQVSTIDTVDDAALSVGGSIKIRNGAGAINGHDLETEPRLYFHDGNTTNRSYLALDTLTNALNVKSITKTAEGDVAFKIDENTFFYKSTYSGLPATAAGMKIGKNSTTDASIIASGSIQINNVKWVSGAGSPEGVVAAVVGSFYSRTDGGAGTSWYVKESGTGNTGWVAK